MITMNRSQTKGPDADHKEHLYDDWKILIGNINTFPNEYQSFNRVKLDKFRKLATTEQADIILLNEHNKNIYNLREQEKPTVIMSNWWEHGIIRTSSLTNKTHSRYEPGGTMIITHTRSTLHTCKAGYDVANLGRWNFITLRGKYGKSTTIISVYRPNANQETSQRQLIELHKKRRLENGLTPTQVWFEDLEKFIIDQQQMGNEVIIGGDFNDDLNNPTCKTNRFMHRLGLREVLLEKYGNGPATYSRGRNKIDGVYATPGIWIQSGHYTNFEDSPSDHRWMVITISHNVLIGTPRDDKSPRISRRASPKIPSVKERFAAILNEEVAKYHLLKKIRILYNNVKRHASITEDEKHLYEQIEVRMQRAVACADKRCRKVKRGAIPYSPLQRKLLGRIYVLELLKKRQTLRGKAGRPKTKQVERIIKKYNFDGSLLHESIQDIERHLKEAYKEYKQIRPTAHEQRDTYLGNLAYEHNERDGKPVQMHFVRLRNEERMKTLFKQLKSCEGKGRGRGVDRVEVPTNHGTEIKCGKREIEEAIMLANKTKLLQAGNTPLRQRELQDLLGEQGDFEKWELILNKAIDLPDNVEEGTKLWFHYIQNINRYGEMDITWTTGEYLDSWKSMSDTKSSTPGIHAAHIKCLTEHDDAAEIISLLALIPLLSGYSPVQWRIGIDSMIPKKQNELRPDKLRLILLMDARFNHNNKLIGKKMMEYGEKFNLLATEQYGSRKMKSSIEQAVNKRMTLDILRQSRTPAIYIANDAKACYDRILLMIAYITLRNYGIPPKVAKSSIDTILRMKHYIRTSYGDSEDYYGGDRWTTKPHGCGQGNGYGPALWAGISSPLLKIMKNEGHGTKLCSPISAEALHISGFAFVDDIDALETGTVEQTSDELTISEEEQLIRQGQKSINTWGSILGSTGGAIEPSKSFWIGIFHGWRGTVNSLQERKSTIPLYMMDSEGCKERLIEKSFNDSSCYLGVWQSPSGDESEQVRQLQDKIEKWSTITGLKKISKVAARMAVKMTIGRTIVYPLTATAMSEQQCKKVQRTFLDKVLGRIGVVRSASVEIATGMACFGGLGLYDIYLQQTLAHIGLIANHGHTKTLTGALLRTTLELYAIETGLPGDPALLPAVDYDTPNTWIAQTKRSLSHFNIALTTGKQGLKKWIDNDMMIMEKAQRVAKQERQIVNKVRLYLQVATLSDLLTADGKNLSNSILHGTRSNNDPTPSKNTYKWPKTSRPTQAEIQVWTNFIRKEFVRTGRSNQQTIIQEARWTKEAVLSSNWAYSESCNVLLNRRGDHTWQVFRRRIQGITRARTSMYREQKDQVFSLPADSTPASVSRLTPKEVFLTSTGHLGEQQQHNYNQSIWVLQNINTSDSKEQTFIQDILSPAGGEAVSDGSYKDGRTTYAFVAGHKYRDNFPTTQELQTCLITGRNRVPGHNTEQNSYRGELAGILASITYVNTLCKTYNVTSGKCRICCDNQGALKASFGKRHPTYKWASYDIVSSIRHQLQESRITWTSQYIAAHQDEHTDFQGLSSTAQANVIADHLANTAHTLDTPQLVIPLPGQPWIIRYRGQYIGGNINTILQTEINRTVMKRKWSKLFGLTDEQSSQADWDLFFTSFKGRQPWQRQILTKYYARILPTGVNLRRRGHAGTAICPGCGETETSDHLFICKNERINQTFHEHATQINDYLAATTTQERASNITLLLTAARHGTLQQLEGNADHTIRLQAAMGQRSLVAGLWHNEWTHVGTQIDQETAQRQSNRWFIGLIKKFQDLALDMWYTRNEVLHRHEDNVQTSAKHLELNLQIDDIYRRKPHDRLLTHSEVIYFSRKSVEALKKLRIQRKLDWVKGAEVILEQRQIHSNSQEEQFVRFFQWDRG